ncbi:MAG: hypothetical protein UR28_C0009G0004 [Candidatus Peregrinibacteria bacterium GW2011_GWF2_33_10]|nr:MAG: hypothetical protein UR28_C0009G0004 [Candidatus Peregrinibacteria bacterium GW2011_GWF2_33_10]OGJ44723.1 MAG: hypothetical protein A2263_02035 [Candidatus Peregrinibacteria bacterium RIFOXYA2_FULL_33_21]OGJ46762.1 MAG: hypothetical protein A2272_02265 [Candidatus Peregrinibacteria bacterium RIFOXYA12_FULL_33_12]OGJ50589.1 MAG: hypothetical protein A2307_00020 [Candidatus Peregrinibacteria bacterium RIFOXYB2_FULL_33_20]
MAPTEQLQEPKNDNKEPSQDNIREALQQVLGVEEKLDQLERDTYQRLTSTEQKQLLIKTVLENKEAIKGNLPPDLLLKLNNLQPGLLFDVYATEINTVDNRKVYEVDFAGNKFAEKKIGLCTLQPDVREVTVIDKTGRTRKGFRQGITGSFFDEHGYIKILSGYKIIFEKEEPSITARIQGLKNKAQNSATQLMQNLKKPDSRSRTTLKDITIQPDLDTEMAGEKSAQEKLITKLFETAYLNNIDPHFLLSLYIENTKDPTQPFAGLIDNQEKIGFEARLYLLIRKIQIIQDKFEHIEGWDHKLLENYGISLPEGQKTLDAFEKESGYINPIFAIYFLSNCQSAPNVQAKILKRYDGMADRQKHLIKNQDTATKQITNTIKQFKKNFQNKGKRTDRFNLDRAGELQPSTLAIKQASNENDLAILRGIKRKTLSALSSQETYAVTRSIFGNSYGAELLIRLDEDHHANGRICKTVIAIGSHEGNLRFGIANHDPAGGWSKTIFQLHDDGDDTGSTESKYQQCLDLGMKNYEKTFGGNLPNETCLNAEDKDLIAYIGYLELLGKKTIGAKKADVLTLIADNSLSQNDFTTLVHDKIQGGAHQLKNGKKIFIGEDVNAMVNGSIFTIDTSKISEIDDLQDPEWTGANFTNIDKSRILKEPIETKEIGGVKVIAKKSVLLALQLADNDFFKQTGKHIIVNSSFRTNEQQSKMNPSLAAPTGHSFHEIGQALDINHAGLGENYELAKICLLKYGFQANIRNEPWHFSIGESNPINEMLCILEKQNHDQATA